MENFLVGKHMLEECGPLQLYKTDTTVLRHSEFLGTSSPGCSFNLLWQKDSSMWIVFYVLWAISANYQTQKAVVCGNLNFVAK